MEKRVLLRVEGMTCQSCANTITGFLKREPGVKKAKIRFKDKGGVVVFDPEKTSEERILKNSIFASGIYRARGEDVRYVPSTHRGHDILTPPAIYPALRTALAPPRYRALVIGLVFGFLGVPAAFSIINYRPHLALAGVAVMVASLHLTSRSILRRCSLPGSQ